MWVYNIDPKSAKVIVFPIADDITASFQSFIPMSGEWSLDPLLSHPALNVSRKLAGATLQINPESDQFSTPSHYPISGQSTVHFDLDMMKASSEWVFLSLLLPLSCLFSAWQPNNPFKSEFSSCHSSSCVRLYDGYPFPTKKEPNPLQQSKRGPSRLLCPPSLSPLSSSYSGHVATCCSSDVPGKL